VLPVIPILIFLSIYGIFIALKALVEKAGRRQPTLTQALLPFIFLASIPIYRSGIEAQHLAAREDYPPNYKSYFDAARWAANNIERDALICARKAEIFHMYSHTYTQNFIYTLDLEEQINFLESTGTDYVILDQLGYAQTIRYLYPAIQRYPEKFIPVYIARNPDTYVLKFDPDKGYSGEWKDDKKNGQGSFVYENGERYEGRWENDLRHGNGRLFYPDGTFLEGKWDNDMLNGPAVLYSNDSTVIEKRNYRNNSLL
jgi:hypothetical protein